MSGDENTSPLPETPTVICILFCTSEEQGFGNPCGYTGKGLEGRGQGMECLTPHKPLPVTEGRGIPSLLLRVSPVMFVGICHITNMVSTNKCFLSQRPPSSQPGCHHLRQPPPPLATVVQPPPPTTAQFNDDNSMATPRHGPICTPFRTTWHVGCPMLSRR